jgi:integrase
MVRRMPYVQPWKGSYRFRRRVPGHLKPIIGQDEWVAALGTKDKAEANRLVVPHIARTDQIIRDAERGDYPPLADDRAESIAWDWWLWFCQERAKLLKVGEGLVRTSLDPHVWALTGEQELTDLLARFVAEKGLEYRPGSGPFDRIKQQCKETHHETAYGYRSEIDDRMAAASQISNAADDQLAALKNGKPGGDRQAVSLSALRGIPCSFSTIIDKWASERKPTAKTEYSWRRIIGKLVVHLKHDNAADVTEDDLIGWKNSLVESGLSQITIENHLILLRTLYNFAADNKLVSANVAAKVKYRAKKQPGTKRLGYTEDDAKRILIAARAEKDAVLRWVPWVAAFTGARVDEICGAMIADIQSVEGVPCLHIRLDYREAGAELKTVNSERVVPLHSALVDEGFLEYVGSLPKDGPLFPNLTPDRFGRRSGNGTKRIGRWVRGERVGITDPRKAPNHSWRHRFRTVCRIANIQKDVSDYLTGHGGDGDVGRDYGDYRDAAVNGIAKLTSPLETVVVG